MRQIIYILILIGIAVSGIGFAVWRIFIIGGTMKIFVVVGPATIGIIALYLLREEYKERKADQFR